MHQADLDFLRGNEGGKSLNQRARLGELRPNASQPHAQPREKKLALRNVQSFIERRNDAFADVMFENSKYVESQKQKQQDQTKDSDQDQ